ncbi:MAG: undecaprenyldiphospho-muramoylpentapeptide beta-N-acetylglucosaminyltransferase, partial [Rhabdochlamydiaceae bacterium]
HGGLDLMSKRTHKVIFAAGGTGGHLFPAQALAQQLLKKKANVELLFAGAKLTDNVHFDKGKFSHRDITSGTPFRRNVFKAMKSVGALLKGIWESLALLKEQKPDLIIGFGSFHTFPLLCAAVIKKVPLILFESNSIPGKVIRLFSKKAVVTAIYFAEAKHHLKGTSVEVEIPVNNPESRRLVAQEEARHQLRLDSDLPTLLVFGGSQGAKQINQHMIHLLPLLKKEKNSFQLIHLTGSEETAKEVQLLCESLNIPCYTKKFETQMDLVWSAADIAICRSGAMTLSELLHYEVPAILIPYPFAADQHQLKNAQFLQQTVGGAIHYPENSLSPSILADTVHRLIRLNSPERLKMKNGIKAFKTQQKKEDLGNLIMKTLESVCDLN